MKLFWQCYYGYLSRKVLIFGVFSLSESNFGFVFKRCMCLYELSFFINSSIGLKKRDIIVHVPTWLRYAYKICFFVAYCLFKKKNLKAIDVKSKQCE